MKKIDAAAAKKLQDEGWTYVDVRSPAEYAAGHPAGAVNIPFNAPNFAELFAKAFPDKTAKVIVGCQMGGRSMRASSLLDGQGYAQLADNATGFEGWSAAKLPTVKGS